MREPSRRAVFGCLLFGATAAALAVLPDSRALWDAVRGRVVEAQAFADANVPLAAAVYFLVYVAVTALSLPAATMMSVLGGALFGRWLGTGLALTAATVGATLAFWSSRYLFRDWVRRRFGHRLQGLNAGVARDGPFFLLSVRLMAIFPFFVLNALIALTPVRTATYVWTTWVGMLPVSFLIVSAGRRIASVDDPARVLGWELFACFALAALVPQIARRAVRRHRHHQGTPDAPRA